MKWRCEPASHGLHIFAGDGRWFVATLHRARKTFRRQGANGGQLQGKWLMKTDVSWRHPQGATPSFIAACSRPAPRRERHDAHHARRARAASALTLTATGANVAVFSMSARAIDLCFSTKLAMSRSNA